MRVTARGRAVLMVLLLLAMLLAGWVGAATADRCVTGQGVTACPMQRGIDIQ